MLTLTPVSDFRRVPLAVLFSLALHGAVIGGIIYSTLHSQTRDRLSGTPAVSVVIVSPNVQPATEQVLQPESEPFVREMLPELPESPSIVAATPPPQARHRAKPAKKVIRSPAATVPKSRDRQTPVIAADKPKASSPANPASDSMPRSVSIYKPVYPQRALALNIDGNVQVQYDVEDNGRVTNIRILSAQPKNMFENEVKKAMRKWRYETGRAKRGITRSIIFYHNGEVSMNQGD